MLLNRVLRYSYKSFPVQYQSYAFYSNKPPTVAVVLSGCGVYDGTEIHEAAAVLSHLSREGAEPLCFAPDIPQLHVVDHTKGQPAENQIRGVLTESARIARGYIQSLSSLQASMADAVVFPGGFGAAKNLSDWAIKGPDCAVNEDVARVLKEFHKDKKPIALCCIAPVLAAKVLSDIKITVGQMDKGTGKWPYAGTIDQLKSLGVHVELKNVNEISFDSKNLIITTPAFMYDGKFHEISDGIGLMIKKLMNVVDGQRK
ncbi:ES1 protein homolog, mitochondrial [Anabrus simplex]|uniref:ES1 protein homolog, mitochondrial n=1 Tax=Anabrus simplex TaxID=316456 RepID=UPI0035A302DE